MFAYWPHLNSPTQRRLTISFNGRKLMSIETTRNFTETENFSVRYPCPHHVGTQGQRFHDCSLDIKKTTHPQPCSCPCSVSASYLFVLVCIWVCLSGQRLDSLLLLSALASSLWSSGLAPLSAPIRMLRLRANLRSAKQKCEEGFQLLQGSVFLVNPWELDGNVKDSISGGTHRLLQMCNVLWKLHFLGWRRKQWTIQNSAVRTVIGMVSTFSQQSLGIKNSYHSGGVGGKERGRTEIGM